MPVTAFVQMRTTRTRYGNSKYRYAVMCVLYGELATESIVLFSRRTRYNIIDLLSLSFDDDDNPAVGSESRSGRRSRVTFYARRRKCTIHPPPPPRHYNIYIYYSDVHRYAAAAAAECVDL